MADPGFPGQHTTTTTVQTSNTTVETSVRFDPSYIRTLPGMIKCALVLLDLLGFICIEASGRYSLTSYGQYFNFVAMTGFWFTGILLAFYLFHIVEKFYKLPWVQVEFGFCAIWTLFYLIAASLALSVGLSSYIAAGFFGFCAMVGYGLDAFLKFKLFKQGGLAQGERTIVKETTQVTTPHY